MIYYVWFDEEMEFVGVCVDCIVNVNVGIELLGFVGLGDVVLFGDVFSCFVGCYVCFYFVVWFVLYEGVGGLSWCYLCMIKMGDWL